VPTSDHAPQRIAIVRLSHLGDVVLALPVFHALRERFPRAQIAWIVQSEFAPLLEGMPGLDRVLRFDRRGGLRAWLTLRRELAAFSPELAVDAQGNLKSGLALLCTGAARRVGLARRDWRECGGSFAMTESCAPVELGREHAMERMRALCRHLSPGAELRRDPRRDPSLTESELARGRAASARLLGEKPAVVLQISSADDVRSWPLAGWEELARALAREGQLALVLSGPGEEAEGRELAARTRDEPRIDHWVGQRGLRQLAAFFTAAAEGGVRFVGCDTGPTHLAAACGLPVTVLCGPHSHLRTGPWPVAEPSPFGASSHRAIRAALQPSCAPCLRRQCDHALGPVCMRNIFAAQVLEEVRIAGAPARRA